MLSFFSLTKVFQYPPTHVPQSPAPGDPSGLSKWPFIRTDGSVSSESTDEILSSVKRGVVVN